MTGHLLDDSLLAVVQIGRGIEHWGGGERRFPVRFGDTAGKLGEGDVLGAGGGFIGRIIGVRHAGVL